MAEFPNNSTQALALEWVKAQDLAGKTPEEVESLYRDALNRIIKKTKSLKLGVDGMYHYDV